MNKIVKRTLTGLVYLLLLAVSLLNGVCFAVIMGCFMVVMIDEFYRMALGEEKKHYVKECLLSEFTGILLVLLMFLVKRYDSDISILLLVLIPLIINQILLLFNPREREAGSKSGILTFPLTYIALPIASSILLVFDRLGNFNVLYFVITMILICISDVGAYLVGMAFGQREKSKKLYPAVSPKQSWAGVFGALFFVFLTDVVFYVTHLEDNILTLTVISLIVVILGILGDLFESLIKRQYGKKDSGSILPGHGGMLDRLDGALFVIPAVVVYLKIMLII